MVQDSNNKQGVFRNTLNIIKKNKSVREEGGYNSIPFGIPELDRHIPGIMKGMQYIVTASSGVGKTQFTKDFFVNRPYKFIKAHPELGIKLKVLYFALEESKEEFMLTLISNRLKEVYNITVDIMQLRSMGDSTLPDEIVEKIEECQEYFEDMEKSIEVIDTISNPYGIYKYVRNYAEKNGTFHWEAKTFKTTRSSEGGRTVTEEEEAQIFKEYIPNDEKEIVIVVIDHLSLLLPEKGDTLHAAMSKISADYGRKWITKHFGFCLALVQQQAAEKEKLQFTLSGISVESKLEPSLDGLGDNKLTQRDALVVLGLFAPERYMIERHLRYDITILQDNYRCLSILKNRFGTPNVKLPLLFNGQSMSFNPLPKIGSPELEQLYSKIKKYREKESRKV